MKEIKDIIDQFYYSKDFVRWFFVVPPRIFLPKGKVFMTNVQFP